MIAKICLACFRKRFGADAMPQRATWSQQCWECKEPTPGLGLLYKVEVPAEEGIRR